MRQQHSTMHRHSHLYRLVYSIPPFIAQSACTILAKHANTFQYTLTSTKTTFWKRAGRFVLFSSSLSAIQTHGGGYSNGFVLLFLHISVLRFYSVLAIFGWPEIGVSYHMCCAHHSLCKRYLPVYI